MLCQNFKIWHDSREIYALFLKNKQIYVHSSKDLQNATHLFFQKQVFSGISCFRNYRDPVWLTFLKSPALLTKRYMVQYIMF